MLAGRPDIKEWKEVFGIQELNKRVVQEHSGNLLSQGREIFGGELNKNRVGALSLTFLDKSVKNLTRQKGDKQVHKSFGGFSFIRL